MMSAAWQVAVQTSGTHFIFVILTSHEYRIIPFIFFCFSICQTQWRQTTQRSRSHGTFIRDTGAPAMMLIPQQGAAPQ